MALELRRALAGTQPAHAEPLWKALQHGGACDTGHAWHQGGQGAEPAVEVCVCVCGCGCACVQCVCVRAACGVRRAAWLWGRPCRVLRLGDESGSAYLKEYNICISNK